MTIQFVCCAPARLIFGLLVIAAMGLAQLLGVSRGYWCECAPVAKMVEDASCLSSACHPHFDHLDGCHDEVEEGVIAGGHKHSTPCDHDHQHREVRESLQTTAVATVITVPVPLVYDLPPSMLMAEHPEITALAPIHGGRSRWGYTGSPPTPMLVARTVVMLI